MRVRLKVGLIVGIHGGSVTHYAMAGDVLGTDTIPAITEEQCHAWIEQGIADELRRRVVGPKSVAVRSPRETKSSRLSTGDTPSSGASDAS